MFSEHPKKVNNLLIVFRGEIITLQEALASGVVKAYLDSGSDEIVCLEIDPTCVLGSELQVMLPIAE